ncbi:prepilin-type N-terminal cleavage/methylation domain-containing protein [Desulfatibacillum alkenivorans DSM 16219]|jgi:prepilin-type N-terminal cleavage/methylation domain-containing protein|uniref:Prepilin-type N-terminal cleavage/methylation domain-containing protein n=1 Tax=Desulfatibacillum alkenivorans DSM 16219 TaxID=1121393 RepID=A0A1M6NXY9_9BACT|nr:prepilin-type N-terminal cleavage/methylation domain-containing protein [Desulfatibacillum alkenivorans]SHK00607.1 prepilin-type N-terminal cleavage/methylation domain-containing protein [Desulfatibacillum alkenivorans DSM 16219]
MKCLIFKNSSGFSLLEIIVTLTVAAVLATVLIAFTGTAVQRAGEPAARLSDIYGLQQVMENITGYYVDVAHGEDALSRLYNAIESEDTDPSTGFGAYKSSKSWVYYNASREEVTSSAQTSDTMLKIVLEPVAGESTIKLTAFFVR